MHALVSLIRFRIVLRDTCGNLQLKKLNSKRNRDYIAIKRCSLCLYNMVDYFIPPPARRGRIDQCSAEAGCDRG